MTRRVLFRASELLSHTADVPQLVDGMILESGLHAIVGAPAAGKTFVALALACSVATGLPWLSRDTKRGHVLYVAGEGVQGLPKRIQAWCLEQELAIDDLDSHLAICRVPMDLTNGDLMQEISNELDELELQPCLVVIDTLSSNAPPGFDENRSADMKGLMDVLRDIRDQWKCAVLVVHHMGHGATRERGSSDFRASLDMMFFVKQDGADSKIEHEKSRDLIKQKPIAFELKPKGRSAVVAQIFKGVDSLAASHLRLLHLITELGADDDRPVRPKLLEERIPRTTLYRLLPQLQSAGMITRGTSGIRLTPRGDAVVLSDLVKADDDSDTPMGLPHDSQAENGTPTELPTHSRGVPHALPPYKGERGTGSNNGNGRSHGTSTELPREFGPGLESIPFEAFEGSAP